VRFLFHLLVMFGVALAVGFGLSWFALNDGRFFGTIRSGPWIAWSDAGAPVPNPYTRAHTVREGTLPLGQAEGLVFTAATDSEGEPLDRSCAYVLEGTTPVATFWTLHAVDADGRIVAGEAASPTVRSSELVRPADGTIVLHVGTTLAPGNWLELSGDGPFSLRLALYDTALSAGLSSAFAGLPAIRREGCA
jgi:hypothetical protein